VSGASSTNTRLPLTLLWMNEDDELPKAFCISAIITSPGTRKLV